MLTERAQQIATENGIFFSFSANPRANARYNIIDTNGKVLWKYKTFEGLQRRLLVMARKSIEVDYYVPGLVFLSDKLSSDKLMAVLLFSALQPNLAVDFGIFQIKHNIGQLVEYKLS